MMRLDERGEQAIALAMLHAPARTEYEGYESVFRSSDLHRYWPTIDVWCRFEFEDREAAAELYCWVYDLLPVEGD